MGAAAVEHFFFELRAMGIAVAVRASLVRVVPVGARRAWMLVASTAGRCGMSAFKRKTELMVQGGLHERRSKAQRIMAGAAVAVFCQRALVHILMTVGTLFVLERAIACCARQLFAMTTFAVSACMLTAQRKRSATVHLAADVR